MLTHHDKIGSSCAESTWVFNGFHREEFDGVTAVLRRLSKYMLRDKASMFCLQWTADFLGVFGHGQVLHQIDTPHFINIVKASRSQNFPENNFIPFESRNTFLHTWVDDFGVFRHVLGSTRRRLPCSPANLFDFDAIVISRSHGSRPQAFCLLSPTD